MGKDACHRAGHPELESPDPHGVGESQLLKDGLCPPRVCCDTHTHTKHHKNLKIKDGTLIIKALFLFKGMELVFYVIFSYII